MLSRLKAWWATPMVKKADFDAIKQEVIRNKDEIERLNIKVEEIDDENTDLREERLVLRGERDSAIACWGERGRYITYLESEIRRLTQETEGEGDECDDGTCDSCGNDIGDCDCFDDEFDCGFCGMDIDDCTCDDDEDGEYDL